MRKMVLHISAYQNFQSLQTKDVTAEESNDPSAFVYRIIKSLAEDGGSFSAHTRSQGVSKAETSTPLKPLLETLIRFKDTVRSQPLNVAISSICCFHPFWPSCCLTTAA